MSRAPLTSEECERRAAALAVSEVPAPTTAKKTVELPPIIEWQTKLARSADAGRGPHALVEILTEMKKNYADDTVGLLSAIDKMRECAERHLCPRHDVEAVNAIFSSMFPSLNDELDKISVGQDVQAEIRRLAALPLLQYDRERKAAAERLEVSLSALDAAVKAARPKETKGQGRPFELPAIELWPAPVDGAGLLDEVCVTISRYVVMPSESVTTLSLWTVHTHCFDCFGHSPRAAILSPEMQCGKTTTLDVLSCLAARPLPSANTTVSAIFRIVEMSKPTLLIDEADTFLKENNELRGILNSGHRRGGQVTRTVGEDHEPRQFSTWAPAAIAMIGRLPDTLTDRSVIINLRRRKPAEKVEPFRIDRADHLKTLARKMARWAADHHDQLAKADPDMGELSNRTADNWRPLFAIADECGGEWPKRVREIASAAVAVATEPSVTTQLLDDIRWIFDGRPDADEKASAVDRMASQEMTEHLVKIEGRLWAEWKGRALTPVRLAHLLRPFGIQSRTIRLHSGAAETAKGYYRGDFEEAFSRYLPLQGVTPSQLNNNGRCDALQGVTAEDEVTLRKTSQSNNDGPCDGVTFSPPLRRKMGSADL
jgi:putative DNA primase/helicase